MSLHIVRVRQPGVALFTAPFHRALFDTRPRKSRLRLQTQQVRLMTDIPIYN